mmetsp:Transcript_29307/g.91305  ORF Transcript_29307/g.91305 Transcript_29307/m.91305 type:complete len:242 (-) Transcript_29307:1169-1894(-)
MALLPWHGLVPLLAGLRLLPCPGDPCKHARPDLREYSWHIGGWIGAPDSGYRHRIPGLPLLCDYTGAFLLHNRLVLELHAHLVGGQVGSPEGQVRACRAGAQGDVPDVQPHRSCEHSSPFRESGEARAGPGLCGQDRPLHRRAPQRPPAHKAGARLAETGRGHHCARPQRALPDLRGVRRRLHGELRRAAAEDGLCEPGAHRRRLLRRRRGHRLLRRAAAHELLRLLSRQLGLLRGEGRGA